MNKRIFGMAPGGRMALDRAANRRRNVWFVQQKQRPRERKGGRPWREKSVWFGACGPVDKCSKIR